MVLRALALEPQKLVPLARKAAGNAPAEQRVLALDELTIAALRKRRRALADDADQHVTRRVARTVAAGLRLGAVLRNTVEADRVRRVLRVHRLAPRANSHRDAARTSRQAQVCDRCEAHGDSTSGSGRPASGNR
eukprot:CAMPEP_0119426778 /NCGR_PEP_ID=MMETSP1335-20130426/36997_1 /TAXON_ID=259385 /ORGANISM="Chrysoculter rhomboideus, Strain RCC1486" /LENGTH=133 /DNA_ID=CAMNT_0007452387 /DNA_START=116 /DNA_END=516 /DNA_ORIENTATION=-